MEKITPPGKDDEDEQRTFTALITTLSDYRRRHHRAGHDILGPRPEGLAGEEWDHLTNAIDLYTHACVARRLKQIRERTAAARTALKPRPCPSTSSPGPTTTARARSAQPTEPEPHHPPSPPPEHLPPHPHDLPRPAALLQRSLDPAPCTR
ncbi:hypothetical protein ACFQ60_02265 [Streptomyces zhihengii]